MFTKVVQHKFSEMHYSYKIPQKLITTACFIVVGFWGILWLRFSLYVIEHSKYIHACVYMFQNCIIALHIYNWEQLW